mmetsp:Transcript_17779/g.49656  ORF Transcript_17779/g.49656 Transcript_17779/m.49656 type:complete len:274 (-) Transcript_17779:212-1033(-)
MLTSAKLVSHSASRKSRVAPYASWRTLALGDRGHPLPMPPYSSSDSTISSSVTEIRPLPREESKRVVTPSPSPNSARIRFIRAWSFRESGGPSCRSSSSMDFSAEPDRKCWLWLCGISSTPSSILFRMPGVVSMMLLGGDSLGGEAPMTRWLGGLMIGLKLGKGPEVTGLNMDCWGLRMFSTCVLLKGTSQRPFSAARSHLSLNASRCLSLVWSWHKASRSQCTLMAMTNDLEHRPMMVRSRAEPGLLAARYTNCSRYCSMEGSGSSFNLLHK